MISERGRLQEPSADAPSPPGNVIQKGVSEMKGKLVTAAAAAIASLFAPGLAAAQQPDELLRALPDDKGVAVVDVKKVIASELWMAAKEGSRTRGLLDALTAGLDRIGARLADADAVAITFSEPNPQTITAAVTGSFDEATVAARLKSIPGVKHGSEKYKGAEIHTIAFTEGKSERLRSLAFVGARTMVIGTVEKVRAAVDVNAGAAPSVAANLVLKEALGQTPPAAVRFAVAAPGVVTSMLPSNSLPLPDFTTVRLIFGTVEVNSGLDASVTLRNEKPEQAQVIADQLNSLLAMARGFLGSSTDPRMASITQLLKSITIDGRDVDVKLGATLSKEFLASMVR
jgi:hypothetical protein